MKAIRLARPEAGAIEVADVEKPTPARGQALVKVLATGICGTDRHIGNYHPSMHDQVTPPLTFGHEFCGEVESLGPDTEGLAPGTFVAAEMHEICGHCYPCRTGRGHICKNTIIYGLQRDGCFAEYVVVPASNLVELPRDVVPLKVGAFLDALGNAVHTVLEGDVTAKSVAITGCGPIGAMAAAVSEYCGVSSMYCVDVAPLALERMRHWAAQPSATHVKRPPIRVFDSGGDGRQAAIDGILEASNGGVDVVLEMSGAPSAINDALKILRPGGTMCVLGIPGGRSVTIDDYGENVIFKGLTIKGIIGRKMYDTWYRMLAMLRGGLDVEWVVSDEALLTDFPEVFAKFDRGDAMKCVLYPHGLP